MKDSSARTGLTLGRSEFVAMLSMYMALAALAVDLMLLAFGEMRVAYGLADDSNAIAATVTTYVPGVALGSLFFGPLSDRFGRKPALYLGHGLGRSAQ